MCDDAGMNGGHNNHLPLQNQSSEKEENMETNAKTIPKTVENLEINHTIYNSNAGNMKVGNKIAFENTYLDAQNGKAACP